MPACGSRQNSNREDRTQLDCDPAEPEKKEEIYKRIQDYGYSRLVSGAHFRSDVYAGNIAGAAIAASLLNKDSFRDQLKEVKGEVRKVAEFAP